MITEDNREIMLPYRPENDHEFLETDGLVYGEVSLTLLETQDKRDDSTLAYLFDITVGGTRVGGIHLRMGWTVHYYFAGQIGYWIDEPYRNRGYATNACLALLPLIKKHGYKKIVVGTDEGNAASRRVCEKAGMRFVETVDTPEWSGLYEEGQRRTSIFAWDINTYTDINSQAIDTWADNDWVWSRAISHEDFEKSKRGDWSVLLTPSVKVPAEWFSPFLKDGKLDGVKLLGLASGGGQQMPVFAAIGADCTILDYSEKQLERERMVAAREGYGINIIKAVIKLP